MKTNKLYIFNAFLLISAFILSNTASASIQPLPSLAPMLKKAMPAIVSITAQGELSPNSPLLNNDEDDDDDVKSAPERPLRKKHKRHKFTSMGSGVIVNSEKGFVITNAHVIHDAQTITVTLNDGRHEKAKLIGKDDESDVAILQIKANNLVTIPIADSTKLQVGDFVVAVGNPFGLNKTGNSQTATMGIISSLQRNNVNIEGVENFIQTDAAINPGNSGGALINMNGELIGINTAIISTRNGGSIGIGFAIPINMAKNVMNQIIKYGSIHRGLMGIFVQHITPELASALSTPTTHGALVTQVNAGSPAELAGLKSGDIIQAINSETINDYSQIKPIVGLLRVGSEVNLKVLRDGKSLTLKAKIVDLKKHEEQMQSKNPFFYGLALHDFEQVSPIHGHIHGIQVVGTTENSNGWRAGLRPGDVIVSANKQKTKNAEALTKIAEKSKKQLLLHVLRGPGSLYLVVK